MIDERFTIVQEDRFIEATRDSGYKSTASAIAELADNAFQAKANEFAVHFMSDQTPYQGRGKPPSPVITEVMCVDDGEGMLPEVLRTALRFGGTTRFDDRSGLGRFGMGLPNSSASQCRRLEVYTWTTRGEVYSCYLDIDEIARGEMFVVPEPVLGQIPVEYAAKAGSRTGTMIIWKNCDRLDYSGRLDTLGRELPFTLGQTYRYYLASGKQIKVHGREVKPVDPLFLLPGAERHGASPHGGPLKFKFNVPGTEDTGDVTVRFSLLPEEWQAQGKSRKERRAMGIDRATGFSVVRAGREIDLGYFRLKPPHWTDAWWSCEIAFEPVLDELFGVTHTKQQVKLSERVRTRLEKEINANIATLSAIIVARGKKRHAADTQQAEEIAKQRERFLRMSQELRDKSAETVDREVRAYAEEKSDEGDSVQSTIDRVKSRPFLMDFENVPEGPFYRVRTFGQATVVTLNRDHPFFDKLYQPLCDLAPVNKTAIELMLFALAKAETLSEGDDGRLWYKQQRFEWSRILSVYLDGVQSLTADELAVRESPPDVEFAAPDDAGSPAEKPAPADVRCYKDATGYYESGGFRVLEGSKASGYPSDTFKRMDASVKLRARLIDQGILARDGELGPYTFTRDYVFETPSSAACIIDGNSRSGPQAWGNRGF